MFLAKKDQLAIGTVELEHMRYELSRYVKGYPSEHPNRAPGIVPILTDKRFTESQGYAISLSVHSMESRYVMMKAKAMLDTVEEELAKRL